MDLPVYYELEKNNGNRDYRIQKYDAININKYAEIPCDYDGIMGVPITIMDYYSPKQFEIIGLSASWDEIDEMRAIKTSGTHRHGPILHGAGLYRRVFIRKKADA